MFKFIITGFIVYFVYRFFIAPPVIDREGESTRGPHASSNSGKDSTGNSYEDDYIDYEEVE